MGPIVVIVGMILMIVIHEGGHFVAAKLFDMKATEAFFGFGPRLWSTQRGETEYGLKAIPLGGYVRIVGMNPFEDVAPEEEHRTYRFKPFWQKTVVVLAGIFTHFVIGFILFYIVSVTWNSFVPTTQIAEVDDVLVSASGATNEMPLQLEAGDRVISVDGVPLADVGTTTDKPPNEVIPVVVERDGSEVTLETNDDVVATPGYLIGLEPGDRLVAVDGETISDWDQFAALAQARPAANTEITIERNGETITNTVVLAVRQLGEQATGFVGVRPEAEEVNVGPLEGIGKAAVFVKDTTWLSLEGLWTMVRQTPQLLGAAVGQDASVLNEARPVSVIGIARVATGLESALAMLAYVNIFVGTLNFIPLYPLDGGHFAVAAYEKIRGRKADVRRLIPVAAAVFIFIMMLGVLGIYFDIVDPIPVPR
jgi:RIP metalloprotease RseP